MSDGGNVPKYGTGELSLRPLTQEVDRSNASAWGPESGPAFEVGLNLACLAPHSFIRFKRPIDDKEVSPRLGVLFLLGVDCAAAGIKEQKGP